MYYLILRYVKTIFYSVMTFANENIIQKKEKMNFLF